MEIRGLELFNNLLFLHYVQYDSLCYHIRRHSRINIANAAAWRCISWWHHRSTARANNFTLQQILTELLQTARKAYVSFASSQLF